MVAMLALWAGVITISVSLASVLAMREARSTLLLLSAFTLLWVWVAHDPLEAP
jgi:hypothetical protein